MGIYWAEIADAHQTGRQIEFLKRHLEKGDYILDVACGSGRHTIGLSEMGFDLVGLDVSAKLLRIAKQRRRQIQLVRGDMRCLPFKSETFDSAVAMDTSFGYLPSKTEDAQSLTEIRRVLSIKGKFIIDVFNQANLAAKYQKKSLLLTHKEYPSFSLDQKQTLSERGDRRFDRWEVHEWRGGQVKVFEHTVRLYKRGQLERLLINAGFMVKEAFGDYEGQDFSVDTPQLILVAFPC
jgi:ubiquinone/menaquinone biosynthesis C-methylase UbiE